MFCSKCQSLLKPIVYRGKVVFRCPSCKKIQDQEKEHIIKENFNFNSDLITIEDNIKLTNDFICPNCGHPEAQLLNSSNDSDLVILKCSKCGYTENRSDK